MGDVNLKKDSLSHSIDFEKTRLLCFIFTSSFITEINAYLFLLTCNDWSIVSYWTEQLAFTVTRVFHAGALPPISAEFFHYPEDLFRPDLHIFLDFGEAVLTTTPSYPVHYTINNFRKTSNLRKRYISHHIYLLYTLIT